MKYFLGLVCLLAAGFLLCVGFYGSQKFMIEMKLQELTYVCPNSIPQHPAFKELRKEIIAAYDERNESFKNAAKTSTTYKEFKEKSDAISLKWEKEDKVGKIIEHHMDRELQKYQEWLRPQ